MTELEKIEKSLTKLNGELSYFKNIRIPSLESQIKRLEAQAEEFSKLPVQPKRTEKVKEFPIRVAANMFLVEPESFPRMVRGSDYGTEGRIIAKKGTKVLVWYKGHNSWHGIGTFYYTSGALAGFDTVVIEDRNRSKRVEEFSGKDNYGTSTLKDMLINEDEGIKEFLNIEFSLKDYYKAGTTLVIEELVLN